MDDWNRTGEIDWKQIWLKQEQEIRADTRCSFCGKRRDQVSRQTAGPDKVYICDVCVDLYREHLAQRDGPPTPGEKTSQICTSCGIRVPASHRYCYHCGSPFVKDSKDSENT